MGKKQVHRLVGVWVARLGCPFGLTLHFHCTFWPNLFHVLCFLSFFPPTHKRTTGAFFGRLKSQQQRQTFQQSILYQNQCAFAKKRFYHGESHRQIVAKCFVLPVQSYFWYHVGVRRRSSKFDRGDEFVTGPSRTIAIWRVSFVQSICKLARKDCWFRGCLGVALY